MKINAVFFDLDDTLHDHLKPFSTTIKNIFPFISTDISMLALYKKMRYYSDILWDQYSQNQLSLTDLRTKRIIYTLEEFDINISTQDARRFQQEYEISLESLTLFPDVENVLKELRNQEITLGIITNGPSKHQSNKIKKLALTTYISKDNIFISDDVGVAKPDSKIFHIVAKKVGYSPENILYVGDSWRNDVVGASNAGWQTLWFNHRNRQPETEHESLIITDGLSSIFSVLDTVRS